MMEMFVIGLKRRFFKINFLIIENKISKAGYHSNNAIKWRKI